MINAALLKLINDAGGTIVISTEDLFEVAKKGTLALSLSDDDKFFTLTRVLDYSVVDGVNRRN